MRISEGIKNSFEKLSYSIVERIENAEKSIALEIADLIREKQQKQQMAVLGLATGSTPLGVYNELARMHNEDNLSFKNVITFNLDEYYPMDQESKQSYFHFMHENLFNRIDILPENIHIPNGSLAIEDVDQFCTEYEKALKEAGGIDIQLLGVGRSGHIGFNEPGSDFNSITRLVKLHPITITDAAHDFKKQESVPVKAITMGISTILSARQIIMMAWGEKKSKVVKEMIEGEVTTKLPATIIQEHSNVKVYIDQWAASELTRIKTPWLSGVCKWDEHLKRKAVVWLSRQTGKPILKLTEDDYNQHQLRDLLVDSGMSAYNLNLDIYTSIQKTITGWPGGKPNVDDSGRPERANPFPKRSLIFSPHPDDDVISMGGTLLRLVDQGHEVHVAYQTSGNLAVFDDDARRFTEFIYDFTESKGYTSDSLRELCFGIFKFLDSKNTGDKDNESVRLVKQLIRKGEANAACRFAGVKEQNRHFLNLPFYETGEAKKNTISEIDIQIVASLLEELKPQQIFAAGDLRDPHGTHKVCLDAIFAAIELLKDQDWMKGCYVWLYRGAWQEWDVEEIEMAVPISPDELMRKRKAIFKHQSQKDSPAFPGEDKREFWQRSEERNKKTAETYDLLGFTEYEALEAFVRYRF